MDLVPTILIPVAVSLALGILVRSAKSTGVVSAGRTTLQYGRPFRGFALFFGLVTLAIAVGVLFVPPKERIWVVLMVLMFALISTPLILEGYFVRIVYSEQGLEAHSPWRKPRSVAWADLLGVSYSDWAQWHRVETRSQGIIRLPQMLSGVPALLVELERRGIRAVDV